MCTSTGEAQILELKIGAACLSQQQHGGKPLGSHVWYDLLQSDLEHPQYMTALSCKQRERKNLYALSKE